MRAVQNPDLQYGLETGVTTTVGASALSKTTTQVALNPHLRRPDSKPRRRPPDHPLADQTRAPGQSRSLHGRCEGVAVGLLRVLWSLMKNMRKGADRQ